MNTLNFVVPGPNGYIWIGSQEGLVRFDGKRFVSVDDIYGTQISGHP
ncbi:MAG: hypothetical protein H6629_21455 [Calditrichae bacterium]|nr:hypothetical protein [Calditrichia bacterium]